MSDISQLNLPDGNTYNISAVTLGSSNVGSNINPIYLNGGIPTPCSYTVKKSVPSDAVFTDTTYSSLPAQSGGTDLSLVTTGEKYDYEQAENTVKQNQIDTTDFSSYAILLSGSGGSGSGTKIEETNKCYNLTYNAFTGNIDLSYGDIVFRQATNYGNVRYSDLYIGNAPINIEGTAFTGAHIALRKITADSRDITIKLDGYTGDINAISLNGVTIGNPPRWEGTQAQYDALATYDPNTIYYITDGVSANVSVINDLSDVSILSPQDGQTLTYNSTSQMWTNTGISTACSVQAGPLMPSGFPVPTVTRRGNLVQVVFGIQLPAGTYANTDVLWYINPVPISIARVQIALGGSFPTVNFSADGGVKFNGAQTLSSTTWFIGQAVYLTDGAYIIHGQTDPTFVN